MPDDFSLMDPHFRLARILAWLVPLLDAIELLNSWVRLGHCSLSLQHRTVCMTVESKSCFERKPWIILLPPLKNA